MKLKLYLIILSLAVAGCMPSKLNNKEQNLMNRLAYAFYQDANPLAAKEYAKLLWKSDIKDTASAVYLSAMINARVDSLHCADKTAHYAFSNNMKSDLTPII